MARKAPWWRRLAEVVTDVLQDISDTLTGTTRPPQPRQPPPRPPSQPAQRRQEPPPYRPVDKPISSESSYEDLERAALNRIDSFRLQDLPDRVSVDRYGKTHVHPAEYNRERVWGRVQELPKIMLQDIAGMNREEFRSWCILNGFFYH